jgi:heme O synthase-like polyprenyltransferase
MKSIEILHPSFGVYAGVLVAGLVVIAGLVAASPRVSGHLRRLGKCAIAGVAAATALVVYVNSKHHAELVASAARPVSGHRLSVAYILADGFAFTALVVTVVLFTVATLAARRRRVPAFSRSSQQRRPVRTGWPE